MMYDSGLTGASCGSCLRWKSGVLTRASKDSLRYLGHLLGIWPVWHISRGPVPFGIAARGWIRYTLKHLPKIITEHWFCLLHVSCLVLKLSMLKNRGVWDQPNFSVEKSVCANVCFVSREWDTSVWFSAEEDSFDTWIFIWKGEENGFYHLFLLLVYARGLCFTGSWQSIPYAVEVLSNAVFWPSKLWNHEKLIVLSYPLRCPAVLPFG